MPWQPVSCLTLVCFHMANTSPQAPGAHTSSTDSFRCRVRGVLSLCAIGGPAGAEDLPGTGGKRRPAVRSRAVALSPTGRSWAAATTDGLLLYSLDPGAMFDPTDLADDVTPQARPLTHPS